VLAIILQFNSLRRTLLTFLTIPLILVGIPYGLLAAGQPLSFFGTLGIISLASQKRLRPILLTSATTALGLAPMAIAGGAPWQPMAVLMMSGLATASLLTLLFMPAGYSCCSGSIARQMVSFVASMP
jgi:multidrug efflux pump subunit AcrB